ncbi:MAG: NUDIX domain-containing protein [Nibricoccus sp.]
MSATAIPYKIAVLVFLENAAGEHLLLLRAKPPNLGVWSPIGGKLETCTGESPFECAVRETVEETGLKIAISDLHLFGMIAERLMKAKATGCCFFSAAESPSIPSRLTFTRAVSAFSAAPDRLTPASRPPTAPRSGRSMINTGTASSPFAPIAIPPNHSKSKSRKSSRADRSGPDRAGIYRRCKPRFSTQPTHPLRGTIHLIYPLPDKNCAL